MDYAVELYLNRRMQPFTALKSWTGNVFTALSRNFLTNRPAIQASLRSALSLPCNHCVDLIIKLLEP